MTTISDDEIDRQLGSTEEDDSKQDDGQFPIRRRKGKKLSELRHPRQKYCPQWERDFPWLKADRVDESLGFCTICHKHLVCKKSHLERHQESFRHMRLHIQTVEENGGDGFTLAGEENSIADDVIGVEGEDGHDVEDDLSQEANAPEFLECGKRTLDDDDGALYEFDTSYEQECDVDGDYDVEYLVKEPRTTKRRAALDSKMKTLAAKKRNLTTPIASSISTRKTLKSSSDNMGSSDRLDRFKLLKQIDRDRHTLSEYLCDRRVGVPRSASPVQSPKQSLQRDAFDLFFESVSASVKTLPPKLAAEVKGRVSQLISEYELRAICEQEEQETAAKQHTPATKSETIEEPTATATIDASGIPSIVYTFQQKVRD